MCLNKGKHVLCEKPMAINQKDAQAMIKTARKKNLFLMQGVWSRFFPLYEKLRKLKNNGTLGEIRTVNV